MKQHLENTEENSLFNEAEHEPPSLTVFKTQDLKIREGGPLQSIRTLNEEQKPSSLTVFKNRHLKSSEGGSTPPFFQKCIYKIGVLASAVAHSAIGLEKLKKTIETALALALEPVGVSA